MLSMVQHGWGLCGREERVHKNMMSPLSTFVSVGIKNECLFFYWFATYRVDHSTGSWQVNHVIVRT